MAIKKETALQERIQNYIESKGGYAPNKSHGNMITRVGISDLRFTYKGLAVHFEVKLPEEKHNVSKAQGIHCRLAKKAGGVTAIVTSIDDTKYILELIDIYISTYAIPSFNEWTKHFGGVWDDGTSY